MTDHFHAIVWIDHREARIFHFNEDDSDRIVVHPHRSARQIQGGHGKENHEFFHHVVEAIGGSGAVLLTGPASAKLELLKHIEKHDPQVKPRIAGVETLDHPSDGALLSFARKYFRAADRMGEQRH